MSTLSFIFGNNGGTREDITGRDGEGEGWEGFRGDGFLVRFIIYCCCLIFFCRL